MECAAPSLQSAASGRKIQGAKPRPKRALGLGRTDRRDHSGHDPHDKPARPGNGSFGWSVPPRAFRALLAGEKSKERSPARNELSVLEEQIDGIIAATIHTTNR